ncbi:hypothetical protein ASPVEDRAFT_39193 [Aspergillus versicolor CBS 583.65]|uniref:Major facilitator superfamily (MFS) profile domain-containing protein n=1 Tax=Aspergillus versicolor CBS 583.65 TaxID=1036611 RepID=A0A1L9PEF4_ASPVE|nr:uncharacterized protein ASPVEDRAFT_39193 [Aspergillus versicolor CBS 583.65]OJI99834.1 hypothetical protein ASPVEDRAFT_39193 [Aspergillus versicolor CBS 583.65]
MATAEIAIQAPGSTLSPSRNRAVSQDGPYEMDISPIPKANPAPTTDEAEPQATDPEIARTNIHWKAKWQLVSACLMSLGNGMNDSAPGALLPYIEKDYSIGYATVSLIFIANAVGFILAAPVSHSINAKLGRCKSYALATGFTTAGYVIIACHPPFPAVVVAFTVLGFGLALTLAFNNVFCTNLPNVTTALGCYSGAYGIGGVVSPLFATAMVSSGVQWSLFYTITLAVSVLNMVFACWAFFKFEDNAPNLVQTNTRQDEHPTRREVLKNSLKNRTTILGALFIFAYQGAEVSVSGWVVSFLIAHRSSSPSQIGYVSSGFWAGITLGRFLLVYPSHRIGEKIAVTIMTVGAIAFQLLTWLIPNVIGEAVAVAILGVLLGAVYPCAMAIFARLLPRKIQLSSLSFVSALGSSGGAVFPFMTGLMAQSARVGLGTVVLHPICLVLYGVMAANWVFLPRVMKRSE